MSDTLGRSSAAVTDTTIRPIRTKAILELAWGLTMNLSSQMSQNDAVTFFEQQFANILTSDLYKNDATVVNYLNEVSCMLSAIERTYGFEREVYMYYTQEWDNLRSDKFNYYQTLSDMTSTNDGLASKIVAFVGSGGLAAFFGVTTFNLKGTAPIAIFLIIGALGYAALSPVLKYWASKQIEKVDREMTTNRGQLWRKVKPRIVTIFFQFAKELKKLAADYQMVDNLPGNDTELENLVSTKILPSDDCYELQMKYRTTRSGS